MANIINNNFNFYSLKPYRGEYWDLTLNKDHNQHHQLNVNDGNDNLILFFDLSSNSFVECGDIVSIKKYYWQDSVAKNYKLENVGYCGFDNGLLYFQRDRVNNKKFIDLYQNSIYEILENDYRMKLHFVKGCSGRFNYNYEILDDCIKLNGGFLQGFFKTECNKYQVLPSKFNNNDVLTLEFLLKPSDFVKDKSLHLNDIYPNNKGFFFYVGTRAENKWSELYETIKHNVDSGDTFIDMDFNNDINDCECNENCCNDKECLYEYVEPELNISSTIYNTKNNIFTIGEYEDYEDYQNPFLLLNHNQDGFTVKDFDKNSSVRYIWSKTVDKNENLFLSMNRTHSGKTVTTLDEGEVKYNIYKDLYENALGFRITDNGEIGYRYLINNNDMPNNMEIIEGYSNTNIIKNNEWNHIVIKIIFNENKMYFKFYVNGNLVFITKYLPKLNLRPLDDIYEKQETVPFNISLGGGTQGLLETVLPNYMETIKHHYPLEENFAGTFNGYIKTFKIYEGDVKYKIILRNFLIESGNLLK